MGGNAVINGYSAQPIPNIRKVTEPLLRDLKWLLAQFGDHQFHLHPSGSTEYLFNEFLQEYSEDGWGSCKETFGDLDFMFDKEDYDRFYNLLKNTLELRDGIVGNGFILLGIQKTDQIITIWMWNNRVIQIDFEPAEFVGGSPTEWALFSHNSASDDIERGVKGVFHKHLLRALNAPDVKDVLIKNSKGFKETKSAEYAMSVTGLRRKLFPVMVQSKHKNKEHLMVDGKLVYHEVNGKNWVTDLGIIFSFYFGKDKTHTVNPNRMWSFVSLLEMLKETKGAYDRQLIANGFVNTLWGKGAQKLYRNNDKKDEKEKRIALKILTDIFEIPYTTWDHIADDYYGRETSEH